MQDLTSTFSTVIVNESIKQVESVTHRIYTVAINAMLIARKINIGTGSFTAVTTELRHFSNNLNNIMKEMKLEIENLVVLSTLLRKKYKSYQIWEATQTLSKDSYSLSLMNEVMTKKKHEKDQAIAAVQQSFEHLKEMTGKALKMCNLGENLSILAKVEASNANHYDNSLLQISHQIENTTLQIYQALNDTMASLNTAYKMAA